jgi:hypothetical protein
MKRNEGDDRRRAAWSDAVPAVGVGALVGVLLTASNVYFGLQSGWVTLASVPAAVVTHLIVAHCCTLRVAAIARRCRRRTAAGSRGGDSDDTSRGPLPPWWTTENHVLAQTTAVAAAVIPVAAGFVGIFPALAAVPSTILAGAGHQVGTGGRGWGGAMAGTANLARPCPAPRTCCAPPIPSTPRTPCAHRAVHLPCCSCVAHSLCSSRVARLPRSCPRVARLPTRSPRASHLPRPLPVPPASSAALISPPGAAHLPRPLPMP